MTENETGQTASLADQLAALGQPLGQVGQSLVTLGQSLATVTKPGSGGGSGSSIVDDGGGGGPSFAALFKDSEAKTKDVDVLTALFAELGDGFSAMFGGGKDEAPNKAGAADGTGEELEAGEKKRTQTQQEEDQKRIDSDKKVWASKLANSVLGLKKLAAVHKAASIAAVVIDTAKGISSAFSGPPNGPPWPLNIAQAALVAATGAQQIAAIKGQAHDGLDKVPSTGTYLLEKGERVVDKRLNRDLSTYLKGAQTTVNSRESTVTNSPSVNLTINGNAPADSIEKNRGALESMIRDIFADHALAAPFD